MPTLAQSPRKGVTLYLVLGHLQARERERERMAKKKRNSIQMRERWERGSEKERSIESERESERIPL